MNNSKRRRDTSPASYNNKNKKVKSNTYTNSITGLVDRLYLHVKRKIETVIEETTVTKKKEHKRVKLNEVETVMYCCNKHDNDRDICSIYECEGSYSKTNIINNSENNINSRKNDDVEFEPDKLSDMTPYYII